MERLLCGAAYWPEPKRLNKDLALMARAGFNLVFLTLPEGKPDLPGLRRALAAAEKRGLRAVVELPAALEETELRGLLVLASGFACVAGYRTSEDRRALIHEAVQPGQAVFAARDAESPDGADIALHNAAARELGGEYLAFGVPVCADRGQLLSPGAVKLAALTHIASGAAGVVFDRWNSDTRGSCAPGVLGHDLLPGEIYKECSAAAAELARLSDKLAGLKKENRVAVLVSRASGELYDRLRGAGSYRDCLARICGGLYRLNVEYDLVRDDRRDFSRWDLVAAPALCAASGELMEALGAYVEKGGHLIACGQTGFADEDLVPRVKAGTLSRLLGFTPVGLVDAAGAGLRSRKARLPDSASVSGLMELLSLRTASALVTAAHPERGDIPAVTVNGRAAYLAADLAPAALDEVLDYLLRAFRVPLPGIRYPLVLRRARSREGRDLIFFLNHSPVSQPLPYGGLLPPWGAEIRENGKPI